mmetsp:Transcript_66005/g.204541  ORF Transcript_66005/g.204541 Transcript_66005/m.204541 type:complete len:205 (+) Transcript_66005:570-1184(+)
MRPPCLGATASSSWAGASTAHPACLSGPSRTPGARAGRTTASAASSGARTSAASRATSGPAAPAAAPAGPRPASCATSRGCRARLGPQRGATRPLHSGSRAAGPGAGSSSWHGRPLRMVRWRRSWRRRCATRRGTTACRGPRRSRPRGACGPAARGGSACASRCRAWSSTCSRSTTPGAQWRCSERSRRPPCAPHGRRSSARLS